MLTVDIITNEMKSLQGVNRMTEKFILGQEDFKQEDILIRNLITNEGCIKVNEYKSELGVILSNDSYQKSRSLIEKLKQLPLYRSYIVQKIICEKEWKKSQKYLRYSEIFQDSDILFFQTPSTAFHYLKHCNRKKQHAKTILISHADTDPLEQLLMDRKELIGRKYEQKLRERYEFVYKNIDKTIVICSSAKKYMWDTYEIDCPLIINGIEDVKPECGIDKYSAEDGKIHLVSLGSIIIRKGFDLVVNAASEIYDEIKDKVIFHFIGSGKDYNYIESLIEKNGLNDIFRLHGPVLNVANELSRMDVFLFPTRSDTVPVSIIEALRAGLPVFSTNVGEIPHMIDSGAGQVIEANVESTINCVLAILNGKYNLMQMSEAARQKYLSEFSLKKMCASYADVILSIK